MNRDKFEPELSNINFNSKVNYFFFARAFILAIAVGREVPISLAIWVMDFLQSSLRDLINLRSSASFFLGK